MLKKEIIEDLLKHLEKIKEENTLIIVEGHKDKKSLEALGFSPNRIIPLARRALFKVVEQIIIKEKRVIILTDLDKTGKRLYSRLRTDLTQRGVYIDNKLRNFLFRHTKLRQIEGLKNYIERNS
ncbi:toprim domain-containing protein [Candidatus Woesearchaeota archaeon]|nr:toprim domain-containing protein [Candidatus Woesearchaeota archaeon]